MRTTGTIADVEFDGSVSVITLETDHGQVRLAGDSRPLFNALESAFGDDWRGQTIAAEHEGMMMISFSLED